MDFWKALLPAAKKLNPFCKLDSFQKLCEQNLPKLNDYNLQSTPEPDDHTSESDCSLLFNDKSTSDAAQSDASNEFNPNG